MAKVSGQNVSISCILYHNAVEVANLCCFVGKSRFTSYLGDMDRCNTTENKASCVGRQTNDLTATNMIPSWSNRVQSSPARGLLHARQRELTATIRQRLAQTYLSEPEPEPEGIPQWITSYSSRFTLQHDADRQHDGVVFVPYVTQSEDDDSIVDPEIAGISEDNSSSVQSVSGECRKSEVVSITHSGTFVERLVPKIELSFDDDDDNDNEDTDPEIKVSASKGRVSKYFATYTDNSNGWRVNTKLFQVYDAFIVMVKLPDQVVVFSSPITT